MGEFFGTVYISNVKHLKLHYKLTTAHKHLVYTQHNKVSSVYLNVRLSNSIFSTFTKKYSNEV